MKLNLKIIMKRKKTPELKRRLHRHRAEDMLSFNPAIAAPEKLHGKSNISLFNYSPSQVNFTKLDRIEDSYKYLNNTSITWINIDGMNVDEINAVCAHFGIHPLFAEDILSTGQRPKMDELNNMLFVLLNMLFFNKETLVVENEQVSIILGENFVLSFQEDAHRDVFNPVRDKLKAEGSKIRISRSDYLFYSLIDMIVDNYFIIMENLGEKIEDLEDDINHRPDTQTLAKINFLRKEMMFLRRNVSPVRELVNGVLRSESELIEERTEKYFKDVYDHIVQANELAENYRDMMINLQDLYLSNVNLKMNEVMKVMAVVTCLMAPATVIGGIFGMNFNKIPWLHNPGGFWIAVGLMLFIPVGMIGLFRKRGWF